MNLSPEERFMIENSPKCTTCEHLTVLHNYHCCTSCTVPECPCRFDTADCDDCGDSFDTVVALRTHASSCTKLPHWERGKQSEPGNTR